VDHCGNADPKAFRSPSARGSEEPWHEPDAWRRDMAALAEKDNVVCKISGIIARAPKEDWTSDDLAPIIDHCLDVFGPDRVIFGSDWPVCNLVASYTDWATALGEVISNRSRREQEKLLAENATRLYKL
jgi:L-fuconolactonase